MALNLGDVIWNLNSFEDLKKYLRQGNDFCRDVSSVINERVKVEMAYADGLAKIGVRAKKVTGDTLGTMKTAWETLANEFEHEADIRKAAATDLLEQIVKPFKTFVDAQKESRKQAELAIEKAAKTLSDKKSEEMKAKKLSFSRARESESLTAQLESSRDKATNEKELSKLDTKCKKAEENVQKSDKEHIIKVIQAERARLALDSSLRNTSMELQALEEERISYVKNMLKVYTEVLQEAVPKSSTTYDTVQNSAGEVNIDNDIQVLLQSKGSEKQPGEQILFTCFETDMSSPMDSQRRKFALEHKHDELNKVLKSEKKARAGLAKLASVYQETPSFSDAGTAQGVSTQIAHANAVIDCLDASLHHIASSLSTLNGYEPPLHRLADCIQKGKDKQNLPSITLKVPFDRITIGIPEEGDYEELGPNQYNQYDFEPDEFEDIEHEAQVGYELAQGATAERPPSEYAVIDEGNEKWRVLYDYSAAQEDELTIQPGDIIHVISKSEGGWWTGELNGRTGLFPANYVEQI